MDFSKIKIYLCLASVIVMLIFKLIGILNISWWIVFLPIAIACFQFKIGKIKI